MTTEIEKLQSLLQKDPSNFQARRELALILADNGFNQEALANIQYLTKYFPEDAELQYNLGILYEKLKEYENSEAAYRNAIKISPQDDFYYNLGEVLVTLGKWDEAIDAFKKVLKNDPNDGNCFFNLGLCYYNKDEINNATDNFQQAITLNPQDVFAYFYLANIYQENGLTNFAIDSYKKVLAISPDYSWAYFNLAAIAYKNENFDESKEYLFKTVECNNLDIEAYKLLTKICIKQNEIEDIITILETRLEKDENGDLYYILAQVYKKIDNLEEYSKNLELALENALSLSYPKDIVQQESNIIKKRLKNSDYTDFPHDKIEDIEEYQETNETDVSEEYDVLEETDSEYYNEPEEDEQESEDSIDYENTDIVENDEEYNDNYDEEEI